MSDQPMSDQQATGNDTRLVLWMWTGIAIIGLAITIVLPIAEL